MARNTFGPNATAKCVDCGAPVQGRQQRCPEHWRENQRSRWRRNTSAYRARSPNRLTDSQLDELADSIADIRGTLTELDHDDHDSVVEALVIVDDIAARMQSILPAPD